MPKDILIAEYEQLYSEIRYINDKISIMFQAYVGLFTSLMLYIYAGASVYKSNVGTLTKSIMILYGLLGIFLTLLLYVIGFVASRQYAVSKRHRVRYWKAIHAVRLGFVKTCPRLNRYLIMPKSFDRPNISHGELVTPYLFGIFNIIFSGIIFWFIYLLSSINGNEIQFTGASLHCAVTFFMLYLIPLTLLLPGNCAYYAKQLYKAKLIRFNNTYPGFDKSSKAKIISKWKNNWTQKRQKYIIALLPLCWLLYMQYNFHNKWQGDYVFSLISLISTAIILTTFNILYVYPYYEPSTILVFCRNKLFWIPYMPCVQGNRNCDNCVLARYTRINN